MHQQQCQIKSVKLRCFTSMKLHEFQPNFSWHLDQKVTPLSRKRQSRCLFSKKRFPPFTSWRSAKKNPSSQKFRGVCVFLVSDWSWNHLWTIQVVGGRATILDIFLNSSGVNFENKLEKRNISLHSLKLTASLHLKNGGWKTILSFWESPLFQVLC